MWNPSRLWRRKETLDRGEPNLFSLLLLLSFFFKGVYVSRLGPGERLTEVSGITSCIYNTTRVDPSRWCSVITPNKHTTTSPPYISLSLSYPSVAKKQGQETSIDLLHHPADRDGVDSILQLPLLLRVWIGANNNNNGCIGQQPVYIYTSSNPVLPQFIDRWMTGCCRVLNGGRSSRRYTQVTGFSCPQRLGPPGKRK